MESRYQWEYRDFTFQAWRPEDTWSCVTYKHHSWSAEAQQYFWENSREMILAELQHWLDQGWNPLDEVGPGAITVNQRAEKDNNSQVVDIFLWILTLGIAFIVQWWLNMPRRITVYEPVEFRVKMRHPLRQQAVHPSVMP